ncbi:lysine decarboxylase [Azohydromonas sediminis]|uniref:SLOG cluster 4 domain-containing protein n=1 Tax=Azohydromonas sediminis TaxID=2259674 RepID=UPI001F2FE268|nr:lysine decarboxylase [Azohydromonas sediminis]
MTASAPVHLQALIAEVAARQRTRPLRVPVGVIGPRQATPAQVAAAEAVSRGIARMGLALICGGRAGVMEGACRGARDAGGIAIGILPGDDPAEANPYASVVLATGIGEARNAVIARAALCLVAIGDNFGTLSEVAFGRQFGKLVVGLEGAPRVDGVVHAATADEALIEVARCALAAP